MVREGAARIGHVSLTVCLFGLMLPGAQGGEAPPDASILISGEAAEAADALLVFTSDAKALERNYDMLIEAAESAQGDIDRDRLMEAGKWGFLRRSKLSGSEQDSRGVSILWRMADCIWSAPSSGTRQRLAPKFVADVERLMEAGVVPRKRAFEIAYYSVFSDDLIIPDTQPDVVLDFLTRHVEAADEESRAFLWNALRCAVRVCGDGAEDLLAFLRLQFPEKGLPDGPLRTIRETWFSSRTPPSSPITREQYDRLQSMTPFELADVVALAADGRSPYIYGQEALLKLERLRGQGHPETREALLWLLQNDIQARRVARYLASSPLEEDAPERDRRFMDAILDHYESEVADLGNVRAPLNAYLALNDCLPEESDQEKGEAAPRSTYGQKRIADILLNSMERVWSPSNDEFTGYDNYDRELILVDVSKAAKRLSPDTLAHVEARLSQSLVKARSRSDLRTDEREKLQNQLTTLTEEVQQLRASYEGGGDGQ